MINKLSNDVDLEQIKKEGHIDALIQIKSKDIAHPKQKEWNDEREMYHMAKLHRRWFSSSRRESQV